MKRAIGFGATPRLPLTSWLGPVTSSTAGSRSPSFGANDVCDGIGKVPDAHRADVDAEHRAPPRRPLEDAL
jgi:hypothetical protein